MNSFIEYHWQNDDEFLEMGLLSQTGMNVSQSSYYVLLFGLKKCSLLFPLSSRFHRHAPYSDAHLPGDGPSLPCAGWTPAEGLFYDPQ